MQAIQGNRSAIDQIANALNCTTTQLQSAICNVQGAIDKVAGQVGMTSQAVINAVQQQGCEIGNQISSCCCNLSSLINQSTCQTQQMINNQGYENRLETLNQTNTLQNTINQGLTNNREQATSRFNILSAKIDAQTTLINDKFCQLEMREMQNTINQLRDERSAYQASALTQQQTQNLINQLRPTPVPAYPSCSPYQTYGWGQAFYGGNYGCGCNNGCCNNGNAAKRTSSDILDSIDKHRRTLEACDSILEEINPAFKQTKDQDRKIKNLEEKVDRMGSSFDELKELLIKKLG